MKNDVEAKKVRVGIVGCGGIANGKHMPSLKKLDNVELVCFCDIVEERAQKAKEEFGVECATVCTDYKELVSVKDIDVVHVLTPNVSHEEITIAALDSGKHVMCEKPMAMTSVEAWAMCDAAKRNNKLLSIGYNTRSMPGCQYIHNMVKDGALGDVYFCKCPAVRRRGVPGWGVFIEKEKQGGGPLIDIGTHSIDAMLYMIDNYEVESVMGATYLKIAHKDSTANEMGLYDHTKITTEDSAFAFVRFKNGATMVIEASWSLNTLEEGVATICGSEAGVQFKGDTVVVNGERNGALYTQEIKMNPRMRTHFKDENLAWQEYEAKQWIKAVTDGTAPVTKPEQAAVVTEIIEAIYESDRTRKTVYFK